MPVNDQDIRALTYLAKRLRDETRGAGRWDEAGIVAKVAEMRGQNLAITIERVTRHAADPDAKTPGAILRPFTPPATTPPTELNTYDPATCCDICTKRRDQHHAVPSHDHEFVSALDHLRRLQPIDTVATVKALKALKAEGSET